MIIVDFPRMSISNVVNSRGLVCDIVGALFIWRYGLPEAINRSGAIHLICEQSDEAEIGKQSGTTGLHYSVSSWSLLGS